MTFELGQIVYLSEHRGSGLLPCEVTKIGRKWVTLSVPGSTYQSYRVEKATGTVQVNYGGTPILYESEQAFEAEQARNAQWCEVRKAVERHGNCPDHLTPSQMADILIALEPPQ